MRCVALLRRVSLRRAMVPASVALLFGIVVAAQADGPPERIELPQRGLCAHRGASSAYPENTVEAFREAARLGAHQIEFDVWPTKDGHAVIVHDATVDRTTNGRGRIADLTLAQIKQLDAGVKKHARFAGLRVPTLDEALEVMPTNVWLNIHIKAGPETSVLAAQTVARHRRLHQTFLAVGHAGADAARKACPGILICNMERQGNSAAYAADTVRRGDAFIQVLDRMPPADSVAKLREAGVRINLFPVTDPKSLKPLFDAGVDFPLVDDVAGMLQAAEPLGIAPWNPLYRSASPTKRR